MAIAGEALKRLTEPQGRTSSAVLSSLSDKCQQYLAISARGEQQRRRDDRIGGRLWNSQHWYGVNQPRERAAIVANVFRALIHHIVSIETKQYPIPVIEADEDGDEEAANRMRFVVMKVLQRRKFLDKLKRARILCKTTRTSAMKGLWDPTLRGGIGDIEIDVIPGWRLIIDGRCSSKELMQFAGDRSVMTRARAMMFYPDAKSEIKQGGNAVYIPTAPSNYSGSPIRDPWAAPPIRSGGATTINGKPTITAFAGDPGFTTQSDDLVEICEIYHRDLSMYEDEETEKDHLGNEMQETVTDEDGMPQFEEAGTQMLPDDDGTPVAVPMYKLQKQPVVKKVYKRVYPDWRRTTMLMPDGTVLEDVAWDGPLPYAYFHDADPLEGIWSRGSGLDLETLQAMLNVMLSMMSDNLRMATLQAYFASPTSGLLHKVLFPGPGQVIEANPAEVKPVEVPKIDQTYFDMVNSLIALMERVIGAQGIMQGSAEAAPRTDSGAGFDSLAEISGSRIAEGVQRMESGIADLAAIVGWFAQEFYTEKHRMKVENLEGNVAWESVWGKLLKGQFSYSVEIGSTMAWSESAKQYRALVQYQSQLIDRQAYYERTNFSGWRQMLRRMDDDMKQGISWHMAGMTGKKQPGGQGGKPRVSAQQAPR